MQTPTRTHLTRLPVPNPTENTQDQIRQRAYELYEQRGREDGHDWDDWLKAESEVNREAKAIAA